MHVCPRPCSLLACADFCTDLVGQQYSWLGSIVYVAQMIWQPVSSYLIVRMPVAKYRQYNLIFASARPLTFRMQCSSTSFCGEL